MRRVVRVLAFGALVGAACIPDLGGFSGGAESDAGAGSPPPPPPVAPPPPADDAAADAHTDADSAVVTCTPPTRVQLAHAILDGSDAGAASLAVTMPNAQQAGDYVVVGVNYDASACGSVSSITDTAGDKFISLVGVDSLPGALALETWGAANVASSTAGANQIQVTFASPCTSENIKVVEYAGVDGASPIDATTSAHDGSAAPSATIETAHPAMIFAHSADASSASGSGAGWNVLFIDGWSTLAEESWAPTPGAHAVTYTNTSAENWVLQAVALRAVCK